MTNDITHNGVVDRIEGNHIYVRVMQSSACETCVAKGNCSTHESKEKLVDVVSPPDGFNVGDRVLVRASAAMGMKAVVLAYVIPLFIIVAMLVLVIWVGCSELVAVVAALSAVAVYYAVLYLRRGSISRKFSFTVEHL